MKGHLSVLFKYANVLFVSGVVVRDLIFVCYFVVVLFMSKLQKLKYKPV